jgi:hypothetical protein
MENNTVILQKFIRNKVILFISYKKEVILTKDGNVTSYMKYFNNKSQEIKEEYSASFVYLGPICSCRNKIVTYFVNTYMSKIIIKKPDY